MIQLKTATTLTTASSKIPRLRTHFLPWTLSDCAISCPSGEPKMCTQRAF